MSRFWFNYTCVACYVGLIMAVAMSTFEQYGWALIFYVIAVLDGGAAVYVSLNERIEE